MTDSTGTNLITAEVRKDGTLFFYGKHAKSTAGITYHTVAYNISLKNSGKDINTVNSQRLTRTEDGDKGNPPFYDDDDYTIDSYKIAGQDVIDKVITLMKADKSTYPNSNEIYKHVASDDGVTIYFSNEFEVIQRSTGDRIGTKTYKTLDTMMNSVKDLLGVEWGSGTQKVLPSYYDYTIKIHANPYYYQVVYVDADDVKYLQEEH